MGKQIIFPICLSPPAAGPNEGLSPSLGSVTDERAPVVDRAAKQIDGLPIVRLPLPKRQLKANF
jgi:hypothetical protein